MSLSGASSALRLPRALLLLVAAGFIGFGLAFTLYPDTLAGWVELAPDTGAARADVMATYGGLEIGVGLFLAYCARRDDRVRLGLVAAAFALAGFAVIRALGMLLAGAFHPVLTLYLGIEAAGLTLAVWGARLAGRAR